MISSILKVRKFVTSVFTRLFNSGILRCEIEPRQIVASFMISAMLLPIFSLPVQARFALPSASSEDGFEAVNEELPVLMEMWKSATSRIEEWSTPLRSENIAYEMSARNVAVPDAAGNPKKASDSPSDDEKKPKKTSDVEKAGEKETTNTHAASDSHGESAESDIVAADKHAAASLKSGSTMAAPVFNQLPEDEQESVYTAQNNLGSPPGQTEMDSPTEAATLRIRHRAGSANFNFGLPLASLSGRGIAAGVGMSYNSRTWNKSCSQYDANGACTQNHFTYDVEQSWIAPGFSTGHGYLETVARVQFKHPEESSNFQYFTEITPLGITDPDGTRHQMGCVEWNPVFPGTYTISCKTYRSGDGTFITTPARSWTYNPNNSQTPNTSNYSAASFIVTYPNGSKIWYGGGLGSGTIRKHYPLIIQDSNGNRIRIGYKSDQSGRIDYIIDTLNRYIRFYYENDTNGNADKLVAVTIPGMGANEEIQTVRFYYEDNFQLYSTGKFIGQITAPATIRVLKYVYMPSTKTGFKYDYHPNYGMIKKITRLAGMTVSNPNSMTATGMVTDDGVSAATTEYNFPDGSTALADVPKYTKRTDDWQGRTSANPQETFYHVPDPGVGDTVSQITVRDDVLDIVTENIAGADGMLKETSIARRYGPVNPSSNERPYAQLMAKSKFTWSTTNGARNLTKLETTNDSGLTKATAFEYDGYNNQKTVKEYDYAAPGILGTLLKTTEMTYETSAGWINKNLLGLVKSITTTINNIAVSKTLFEYDHNGNDSTLTLRNDISTATHDTYYNPAHPAWDEEVCPYTSGGECTIIHHPGYDSTSAYRGNLTKVTRFADATQTTDPNADVTDYEYDIAGNGVSATLSCCSLKTIAYDKANEYAFPVSETKGSSPQLTTSATYNRNTGLLLTSTNENGQVTTYEYETDTLRPKKTIAPNGGYTETEYSDKLISNPNDLLPGFVRQTTTLETNKFAQSYSYFDGRGLGIRSAAQTPDGWSIAAAEYDHLGRPRKSYNPFYGSTPTAAVPIGTKFTEVTAVDALGRSTSVKLQDDTTVTTEFSSVSTRPASFLKTFVTGTDQAGKKRRQIFDSLGRLVRLDEPDASGNLGDVDASLPSQQTVYEYDGNDNLSKVIQSDGTDTQERKFKYDSLSRLTHERQVEANPTLDDSGIKGTPDPNKWTKVFKYNLDNLLSEGIDARGVKTTFSYDGLNRVSSVAYTGETGYQTPNVTYTYDQPRSGYFNAGALTRVETAAVGDTPATAAEFDYDQMGRTRKHRQWIAAQQYDLEYTYNLAGQVTSEKYPSGRVVSMSYDANGRMSSIADANRTYLHGIQYQHFGGAVSALTLGNGIQQTFEYNDRLQMKKIAWAKNSSVIQRYDYSFGQIDQQSGNVDTTKNNGQLAQVESYNGGTASSPTKQFTQKFTYDSIGRLEKENEYRGDNGNQTYQQKFSFDRFGNRYLKAAENPANQNPLVPVPIEDNNVERSTNRLAANTGTAYDDAGNVISDDKFREMDFVYDANGRMAKAIKANIPDALSAFDAGGNKVATRVNDVWRFQVYDAGGKCVAEYGGSQSTDEGGTKYIHQDIQGSTRTISTQSGFAQARIDYQAFGEQISSGIGQRSAQGYASTDTIRNRYALTERDEATGLDDTWFRKLENRGGRWTSPDLYNGSSNVGSGQSWNRYTYVENQPTNSVDPSGLMMVAQRTCRSWTQYYYVDGQYDSSTDFEACWISGYSWVDDIDSGGGVGGGSILKEVTDLDIQAAMQKCADILFSGAGVLISGFQRSSKGSAGSTDFNYVDGDNPTNTITITNDVTKYSVSDITSRRDRAPGEQALGLTRGRDTTNYTANDLDLSQHSGISLFGVGGVAGLILGAQIHEFGHSLANYLNRQLTHTDPIKGEVIESGARFKNCVDQVLQGKL